MSREFLWFVTVEGALPTDRAAIRDALEERRPELGCNFREWRGVLSCRAEGRWSIGVGMGVPAQAAEIRARVWREVGRFVDVQVGAIYVEEPAEWLGGTEAEFASFWAGLPRCARCGAICAEGEELCDACERAQPDGASWCRGCQAWIDGDDPDARYCASCRADAAEREREGRADR